MVPADSHRISRVPRYSGCRWAASGFVYGALTLYDRAFQRVPLASRMPCRGPTTPPAHRYADGLGCAPFARHYLGYHCLFSLPRGTKMFQFPRFALLKHIRSDRPSDGRVVPFGNLRVKGHLRLTGAYRSLSRPSSPL